MTPAINGTEERLDLVIELLRDLLAELRQANAVTLDGTAFAGELKPAAKKKR